MNDTSLYQHRPAPRRGERGGTLAILTVSLLPVIGMVTAFYTRHHEEFKHHESRKGEMRASMRAIGALELAKHLVSTSKYSYGAGNNNNKIHRALENPVYRPNPDQPGSFLALDLRDGSKHSFTTLGSIPAADRPYVRPYVRFRDIDVVGSGDPTDIVPVYVVPLFYEDPATYAPPFDGPWFVLESVATTGRVTRSARVWVRERDPFTRFLVFIDKHFQGISGSPKGDIHTNETLQIFFPNAVFDDFVSQGNTGSFQYMVGGSAGATTFNSGFSTGTQIGMPDLTEIQALGGRAQGPFHVGADYDDVQVEFLDDRVVIDATNVNTGSVENLHDGPLPGNGLIYAVNDITSIQGNLDGRVTVATEGEVTVTGNLTYVDANGNPARINPGAGGNYAPNPDYTGNSTLGIIANGSVLYSPGLPDVFEMHAAIFSSSGTVGLPGLTFTGSANAPAPYNSQWWIDNYPGAYVVTYDPSFQKQSSHVLGATISAYRWVATVVDSNGTVLSGFQDGSVEYDRNLLNNPPPHFLEIDRPLFRGIELVEQVVQH